MLQESRFTFFTGSTQLRHLCKNDVANLLSKSLPPEWSTGDKVLWKPGTGNHPLKEWLNLVWKYLAKHFPTIDELGRFRNLPLLPLDMSQFQVTLARLTQPSNVIVRSLHGDNLDDTLIDVLKELGVTVMQDCPVYLLLHPALTKAFVHPPSVQGVLRAMAASLPEMASVMNKVTADGKRSLRKFIAKASSLEPEEKQVLHSLPLFETLFKAFVSKKNGLRAAPEESLPVNPQKIGRAHV